MKTFIYCEGTTDLLMLQFVLQYKYGWEYNGFNESKRTNRLRSRNLIKGEKTLEIHSCGGITNISSCLCKLKDKIQYATKDDELCSRVIIMIDHDTIDSNKKFIDQLNTCLGESFCEDHINVWSEWKIENPIMGSLKLELYIECIPEKETGAIETIMLEALETDFEEKKLISESENFVNNIANTQNRYLQKKSRIFKAVFNTYFAIRAPEEKYDDRAKILNAYDWKNNVILNSSFEFLDI
jgi:hypothetical protein